MGTYRIVQGAQLGALWLTQMDGMGVLGWEGGAMQETWFLTLAWKDPLEKEMATHSSIAAWKIPWTEEPGGLQSVGSQRVRHD